MSGKTPVWTGKESHLFHRLDNPNKIQNFLNRLAYDPVPGTRSPRWVIRERKVNCFEGALFAAAALRWLGHRPLVVDIHARNDDDHVIAVFMTNKRWGAIAKSNFTTLRFREPVYRSIRELVMSYFDFYYNTLGEKTLRSYSLPFDLRRFDDRHWMTTDEDLEYIGSHLNQIRHFKAITPRMARLLHKVDKDVSRAGLLGSNKFGLFRPKRK